ncbi:hypothetical protein QE152_g21678 [Popillia japonica]|uniref:Ribosomal protein S14 n=1 Tax=Popillia japonica TaxID=7064 RepID=A0AAW1KL01_POPJA
MDIQMPGPSSAAQLPIIDIVQPSSKLQKSIASTKSMKRKATTLTKRIRVYKFREKQLKSRVQKAKKLQNNYEFQKKLRKFREKQLKSRLLQQLPLKIGNYCNYYLYRVTLFPNQTHNIKKKLQCNFYTAI